MAMLAHRSTRAQPPPGRPDRRGGYPIAAEPPPTSSMPGAVLCLARGLVQRLPIPADTSQAPSGGAGGRDVVVDSRS